MVKDRLFSPVFLLIIATTLCSFLFGQGANAGTTVYLEVKGETATLAGIGALAMSLSAALSRIATGPLSDTYGRKRAIVVGCVIMIVGATGPIFANTGVAFIAWRIFQGVGFSAATTALATSASDVLPLSRLGEGIGYYGLGQAISMSCGPALAIALVYSEHPENFYLGLCLFATAALIISFFIRYEKNPMRLPATSEYLMRWKRGEIPYSAPEIPATDTIAGNADGALRDEGESEGKGAAPSKGLSFAQAAKDVFEPAALRGTIPMMLIATSFGFGIYFMGVYGTHLDVANPSMFYTISAVTMIIVRLTSGGFMDRVRPIIIMGGAAFCGLACYALLMLCLQLDDCDTAYYAAGAFYGISLGVSLPINQTVAVRLSDPERWGAANGLYLFGTDIGIGFASLAWGLTIPALGYSATLACVMACIAASLIAAFVCYPRQKV